MWRFPDSPEFKTQGAGDIPKETEKVIENCDGVTVSTAAIAKEIQERIDVPIYVLPNCLDFAQWEKAIVPNINYDKFLIGWMGGHYHVLDLEDMVPGLGEVLEKNPSVMLVFIGCCPMELISKYPKQVYLQEFVDIALLPKTMAVMMFSLGLAPLHRTEFAEARSNIRLLQYSALRIPSVVANWGEYGTMMEEGFPGIAVDNGSWSEAIQAGIAMGPDQRRTMGEQAFEFVYPRYDIRENVFRWKNAYLEVLDG